MKKRLSIGLCICLIISIVSGCTPKGEVVAKIKGDAIAVEDFNYYLASVKENMQQEIQQQDVKDFWNTEIGGKKAIEVAKDKALDEAVKIKVQLIKAKEMNISLTADDKKQIEAQKQQAMSSMQGNTAQFTEMLKGYGLTMNSFETMLQNRMISQKLYQKVSTGNKDFEIKPEEIKPYYEQNKQKFGADKVAAKHILILTQDENKQPLPEDKKKEALAKAQKILADIKAGADFDKLMLENSQDPGLKEQPEGYYFGKGQMVPEFEKAAFELKEGEVSGIVETSYGYHIIKRVFPEKAVKDAMIEDRYNKQIDTWKKEMGTVEINHDVFDKIEKDAGKATPAPQATEKPAK